MIAADDAINVTSKGFGILDLLGNDSAPTDGETQISHINDIAISKGESVTLATGEVLTLNADGTIHVQATPITQKTTFTYTITNSKGISDTAYGTIHTSPVDGTGGDDLLLDGYSDADGNMIGGTDGPDEVVYGYGGNDKIFSGNGNDDVYGGSGDDHIRAGSGDDKIIGGAGHDVLDGGSGVDRMEGGTGDDIYYVDSTLDTLIELSGQGRDKVLASVNTVLAANFEDLVLIKGSTATHGTGNDLSNMMVGNELGNIFVGNGGDDRILGMAGDDNIKGGVGNDTIDGGAGNDTLSGGDEVDKLSGGDGNDSLSGGRGRDILNGGAGSDTLNGGGANDILDGGTGNDNMSGGERNDIYFVDSAGDRVIEKSSEGKDTVNSTISYTLTSNVENLRLHGTALEGTGNAGDNRIFGNGSDNILSGLDGSDRVSGGSGNDTLLGGNGTDVLFGGSGSDQLNGGTGNDKLKAGKGDDVLVGGTGNDKLYGGDGADEFVFSVGDGDDTVKRINIAEDKLTFSGLTMDDLNVSKKGNGIRIDTDAGDSVFLAGVGELTLADLNIDFV